MQAIFEEAFKFAFKDRNWIVKIVIGGILGLIPIVNLIFLIGYSLVVLKDSVENKPPVLPEWSAWMEYGKSGLRGLLILIVYGIPLIILGALSAMPALGKLFYVLFILVNILTVPVFTLALIQWNAKGDLKAAFDFKHVWDIFTKDIQNYLIATLVLSILPLIVSLILQTAGYGMFRLRTPVLFFPGALIQLLIGCVWFWLSIVGARVYGQLYSTSSK